MSWLRRLFGRGEVPPAPAPDDGTLQKLARAHARLTLRIEELDSKLKGGFADLRASLGKTPSDALDWGELLDALDEAIHHAGAGSPLAAGLAGVQARLQRFLAQAGIERRALAGEAPDGRLFRVVGAEPSAALPDGVVSRVVRAAVLRGGHLLREGEVILTRRSA